MKKEDITLVIGASEKRERYANMAVRSLVNHGRPVVALGSKPGQIENIPIVKSFGELPDVKIHTVSLYLNAMRQAAIYSSILALQPERVIFNPGTENPEFEDILIEKGIAIEEACTLVLLNTGQF
ncbi:MAG: CoA-binding protein [Bacteroidota bacterium]